MSGGCAPVVAARSCGWHSSRSRTNWPRTTRQSTTAAPTGVLHVGDLATHRLPAAAFDVVTLWHVLEHVPDARSCLECARQCLKPDGRLIVAVPNIDSLEARLGGAHWFHLDLPRHQSHFSLRTLERLLADVGFTPVMTKRFSLEYGPYGMLQTLLNRMGFSHNLLYNALKAPGARAPWRLARWARALQLGAMAVLLPVLAPLAAALHLLDGLAFAGSCIEVHAIPTEQAQRRPSLPPARESRPRVHAQRRKTVAPRVSLVE